MFPRQRKKMMHWSCYLWLWLVVTPAISRIALSGFSSHLPGRLTYKYSRVFFLLWISILRYYRLRSLGTSDFSCAVSGFGQVLFRVSGRADPEASLMSALNRLTREKTSGTQGRSTCAIAWQNSSFSPFFAARDIFRGGTTLSSRNVLCCKERGETAVFASYMCNQNNKRLYKHSDQSLLSCYLCRHCFLTRICREQWIRSCCIQWFGCDF